MVEIKYNGRTIAELNDGQSVKLKCKDLLMEDDLSISGATEVTYNGTTIATLTEGQSAILKCKDKQMLDDIMGVALETTPQLATPEISLDGTTLNIYDTEGLATSYDILVDGVVKDSVEAVSLISFSIGSTTYQAEEGMTWAEWCDSEYNTGGYYISDTRVKISAQVYIKNVVPTNTITNGSAYTLYNSGAAD